MKVLIIGDSPTLATGFARVNRIAADAMLAEGWDVASLASLVKEKPDDGTSIKYYIPNTEGGDPWGFSEIKRVYEEYQPDVVYMTADPGTVTGAAAKLPDTAKFVGYIPVEGAPIVNPAWRSIMQSLRFFTCSKYGADVVKTAIGKDIDYVYHGIDNDTFRVNGMRDSVREAFGFKDKFLISVVATNVRRKQLPRIIEAMSILKHQYKQDDIIIYMHTVPFQNYWLDGWNLPEIVRMYGVNQHVMFNEKMEKFNDNVPLTSSDPSSPGLVDILNASDLFVNVSQVEGFGLPAVEAMACGVPVIVTKYAAGWEMARGVGHGIEPHDWEVHKSGTMYGNVDPKGLAKEILKLKRNPSERARMSKLGLERVKDFDWSLFKKKLIEEIKLEYADENRGPDKKSTDTVEEAKTP